MNNKEIIIKQYFDSWIKKDICIIEEHFSKNIKYIECYGPEHNGINQIKQWFNNWNNGNNVLKWDIKRFIEDKNTIVVEWFFKCEFNQKILSFDGVSIIEFDENDKIIIVKEFQSNTEHIFPYNDKYLDS